MKNCSFCGAELPENTRFCGKCGSVQDATATDVATTRSNTPAPYWAPEGGTLPATSPPYAYPKSTAPGNWSPTIGSPATPPPPPPPPPPPTEDEEQRGAIPPWSPLYGAGLGADALMSSGQAYNAGAPVV